MCLDLELSDVIMTEAKQAYSIFPNSLEEKLRDEILSKGKIETYSKLYPGFPKSVILKAEALTKGVSFTKAAMKKAAEIGSRVKSYFLFSYAADDLQKMGEDVKYIPEEFKLKDGPPVQVRTRDNSVYSVDVIDDKLMFCERGIPVWEVEELAHPFDYYMKSLHGVPMYEYAAISQWDHSLFVTAYRACQYWGSKRRVQILRP
jgi:hypothetical protein